MSGWQTVFAALGAFTVGVALLMIILGGGAYLYGYIHETIRLRRKP